jgi:hypothetical protein
MEVAFYMGRVETLSQLCAEGHITPNQLFNRIQHARDDLLEALDKSERKARHAY